MSQPEPYQDVVLGSGAGGKLLAWHLARSGRRVAVVERRWVGGSCPNVACLPSKNEIWSAKAADLFRHAAQFGVVTGPVAVDMAKVRQRKREGPIKTFTLRGIKDSPPYLHDGRCLTLEDLEDTVEFFNLVLELKLTREEKRTWWPSSAACDGRRSPRPRLASERRSVCGTGFQPLPQTDRLIGRCCLAPRFLLLESNHG